MVTEIHTHLVSGPLTEWASISFPHTIDPVTPFELSLSLQLITALNWKEAGVEGTQAFYKEQRNLLTENRMSKHLQQTLAVVIKRRWTGEHKGKFSADAAFQSAAVSSSGKNFCHPLQGKAPPRWPSPHGMQGCEGQDCCSCHSPYMCKFLRGYLATFKDTLSAKDTSLTTGSAPTSFQPQGTHSPAGLTDHDKKLWHSSCGAKAWLHLYFHPTNTVRGSNVRFVFPLFLPTLTVLLTTFMCFLMHTGMSVHIHCEIQAGSKAEPIINPSRGKHSSRYCGTFPAAYADHP